MKEGTRLKITPKEDTRVGTRDKDNLLTVEVLDTIQDIRNVTTPNGPSSYPVVTKYLVRDLTDNSVFSIYTHQIRSIVTP